MKGLAKTIDVRVGPLAEIDTQATVSMLAAASDIALVLDDAGVIRDIVMGQTDHPLEESREWVGRCWADTVVPVSRGKIEEMLQEAAAGGVSRPRQVFHGSPSGIDLPVAYTAVRLGRGDGRLVAIGRDLRAVSALQQRLVEAQQALQRDYWRMRQVETRYRLLFQASTEAMLMVDASTQKVVEANPAAAELFAVSAKKLVGRPFPFDFDRRSEAAIGELLATVRAHGQAEPAPVRLTSSGRQLTLAVALVRQDSHALFVVRLLPEASDVRTPSGGRGTNAALLQVLNGLPDGVVLTDGDGRVLATNRAFLDLVEVPTEEQVRGQSLGHWLGRPGADLGLLLATIREHGVVRLFGTTLRGELESPSEVEVSCAAIHDGTRTAVGLIIRDVGRRVALGPRGARDLTSAVEQLTALVGRVSLKNLVRDTTDLVERYFIEAALEATGDNRTSAAEVLGVSRQSLYVKLRRYQLGLSEGVEGSAKVGRKIKAGGKQPP